MAKFNTSQAVTRKLSPIGGSDSRDGVNHYGASAFSRDVKSELFLLSVSNMVSSDTFYELASGRDQRYRELISAVALDDADWTWRFLGWLRDVANMRSASVVGGVEAARTLVTSGRPGGRAMVATVLSRADEPGEAIAYWRTQYGRRIPKPIKRGIADGARNLYNEFSWLKYDSSRSGFRFRDVLAVTHPKPKDAKQDALFRYICARASDRNAAVPLALEMIRANKATRAAVLKGQAGSVSADALSARLRESGMTWQDALSMAGQVGIDPARMWEAVIPSMGYMALIRNLANFDRCGVSDEVSGEVADRIADSQRVRRSRQLPFRFYSAYANVGSDRWSWPLSKALDASVSNVPAFGGRTLVLVDRSGSMFHRSTTSVGTLADQAALFGCVVALRADYADLFQFGTDSQRVSFSRGDSVMRTMGKFVNMGSTDIGSAVINNYDRHDRVVIVTDEQTHPGWTRYVSDASYWHARSKSYYDVSGRAVMDLPFPVDDVVPQSVPIYTWNLGGYRFGHLPDSVNRYVFGGMSDAAFSMINSLESGGDAEWPF